MKKLFSLLLAGLMIVSFAACSDENDDETDLDDYRQEEVIIDSYTNDLGQTFKFDSLDSETVTITAYQGGDIPHVVEIPSEMHGKKVAGISDMAFYSLSNVTEVKIPNTITTIGSMAFAECRQLVSVTIPASVEEIGDAAFMRCNSLKSVTFEAGSKLTELPLASFKECSSLESVTIPANIETVGAGAFQACYALETIVIEEGVKTLGAQAFQDCKALASITLPASLTEIGEYNFVGSDALYTEGVTLPANAECAAAKYVATLNLQPKPVEPEAPETAA